MSDSLRRAHLGVLCDLAKSALAAVEGGHNDAAMVMLKLARKNLDYAMRSLQEEPTGTPAPLE